MSVKKFAISSLTVLAMLVLFVPVAFAQEVSVQEKVTALEVQKWKAIAAALAISITAFGGALGQGRAAAAALEGIARNPAASGKIFTPMILGLALIESLVIYGLLIAFTLAP